MHSDAQQALQAYLDYLCAEKRVSTHTLAAYRRDLLRLQQYCRENQIQTWRDLQNSDIRNHIAGRHKAGMSGKSLQRELAAIRNFYHYLLKQQLVAADPVLDIRAPKSSHKLPKTLDVDQMAGLLDVQPDSLLEIRDLAMFELFYSSGLRLSELVMLDNADLSLSDGFLRVRFGKGGKERQAPIGAKAIAALQKWLEIRPQLATPALFTSARGARLGQRSVQLRLERWGVKNSLPEHLHPHMLRHSFATHMLESCRDIRSVQELLGHSNIGTTQIYTHLDFQHLAGVYDSAHPRARKKGSAKKPDEDN